MANPFLTHLHSGLRYAVLATLIYAIINSFKSTNSYTQKDKMINLFAMVSVHLQLLIGLFLYFSSDKVSFAEGWMKNAMTRFYGMEHILGMLIATVIITLGRRKGQSLVIAAERHAAIRKWYLIGLLVILLSIPWPFRQALGGSWF